MSSPSTVYVLGAGFTRALAPAAPLLRGDFGIETLRDTFSNLPTVAAVLDDAIAEGGSSTNVDLERLMTRLGGMPYDSTDARLELTILERALRKALVSRLHAAKKAGVDTAMIDRFARHLLDTRASVVTFNYDDILDEALHRMSQRKVPPSFQEPTDTWYPDGGYGFYCRPAEVCIRDLMYRMDMPFTLLLKLHGSVNWRTRLGARGQRNPDAILHHEEWLQAPTDTPQLIAQIAAHLEPDSFIVPPILAKTELTEHSVLRLIWDRAYDKLAGATEVVFIGYSFPLTDLAAGILFRETIGRNPLCAVHVVDVTDGPARDRLIERFTSVRAGLPLSTFSFEGAKAWIDKYCPPGV